MATIVSRFKPNFGGLILAVIYVAVLLGPFSARADTFCADGVDVYSRNNPNVNNSYQGTYTECVPFNFDKSSYPPGEAVTISGSYPYKVDSAGIHSFAANFSVSTGAVLSYPTNSAGNYSYSFVAPTNTGTYSVIANIDFGGYTDYSSFQYTFDGGGRGGGCAMTAKDNGCVKEHTTYIRNILKVSFSYNVACSSTQIANSDGTCSTPPRADVSITANGQHGQFSSPVNVTVGSAVHLVATFTPHSPDSMTVTGITDTHAADPYNPPWLYGGNSAISPVVADWTPQAPGATYFSARSASQAYPGPIQGDWIEIVASCPAGQSQSNGACTNPPSAPTATLTANGLTGNVSVPFGQTVHLVGTFTAASGDAITITGITDYQNAWVPGGSGSGGVTPRTYDWNPSQPGNYLFNARMATNNYAAQDYAQVYVTVTNQCAAGQNYQTNGGVSGCCPTNQTLQANGTCTFSPNPPTAAITANGVSGTAYVTVNQPINLSATFTPGSGDTLTTTGIADYQDAWVAGSGSGAAPSRTYSWTPTLANTYRFNAREATLGYPFPNCSNENCDYDHVTIVVSCPSGQLQRNDGSCVPASPPPPTGTITANGVSGTANATVGQPVNLVATFSPGAGDTLTATGISNYNDSAFLSGGSDAASPRSATWTPSATGSYRFNARATTQNFGTTDPANVVVVASCAPGQTQLPNGTCASSSGISASLFVGTYSAASEGYSCNSTNVTINRGTSVQMCWTCTGADSSSGTGFSTGGSVNDSTIISPTQTYTYTLQCSNQTGSASANATINVNGSTPPASSAGPLTANPALVKKGNSTTLSWSSQNVSSCRLTDDKGITLSTQTSSPGFSTAPINAHTVFTLSCIGTDGRNPSSAAIVNLVPSFREF